MTMISCSVLELAIGLERMSPLGIVAATGLIIGTFLTIVVIPVFYSVLDSLNSWTLTTASSSSIVKMMWWEWYNSSRISTSNDACSRM